MADLLVLSTGGLFPHTHKLTIPASALVSASPEDGGVTLETSEEVSAFFFRHKHPVTLSRDQLAAVSRGETVLVHDDDTQRHTFEIKLEKAME